MTTVARVRYALSAPVVASARAIRHDIASAPQSDSLRTALSRRRVAPVANRVTMSVLANLLQKSFWGGERKFLEPLMRLTRGDVSGADLPVAHPDFSFFDPERTADHSGFDNPHGPRSAG